MTDPMIRKTISRYKLVQAHTTSNNKKNESIL